MKIKRKNQTYFVICGQDDTVAYLKEQVSIATRGEQSADQMRMILPKDGMVLGDDQKLSKFDGKIKNETELHVVFQIANGEWEQASIEDTSLTSE